VVEWPSEETEACS